MALAANLSSKWLIGSSSPRHHHSSDIQPHIGLICDVAQKSSTFSHEGARISNLDRNRLQESKTAALFLFPILKELALWQVADAAVHRPVLGLGADIVSARDAGPAV
jgi:hypothetical protein